MDHRFGCSQSSPPLSIGRKPCSIADIMTEDARKRADVHSLVKRNAVKYCEEDEPHDVQLFYASVLSLARSGAGNLRLRPKAVSLDFSFDGMFIELKPPRSVIDEVGHLKALISGASSPPCRINIWSDGRLVFNLEWLGEQNYKLTRFDHGSWEEWLPRRAQW